MCSTGTLHARRAFWNTSLPCYTKLALPGVAGDSTVANVAAVRRKPGGERCDPAAVPSPPAAPPRVALCASRDCGVRLFPFPPFIFLGPAPRLRRAAQRRLDAPGKAQRAGTGKLALATISVLYSKLLSPSSAAASPEEREGTRICFKNTSVFATRSIGQGS